MLTTPKRMRVTSPGPVGAAARRRAGDEDDDDDDEEEDDEAKYSRDLTGSATMVAAPGTQLAGHTWAGGEGKGRRGEEAFVTTGVRADTRPEERGEREREGAVVWVWFTSPCSSVN